MSKKVLLTIAITITMLLLTLGCRTDKAQEKQNAAEPQPAASPAAANTPASDLPAPQANPGTSSTQSKPKAPPKPETAEPNQAVATAPSPTPTPTPTPSPTPTPTPPPPIVIAAGTVLSIRTTSPISTGGSESTQGFQASLAKPLVSGETTIVPVGAAASGVVLQAKSAGRIKGEGKLDVELTSLTVKGKTYRIKTLPVSEVAKGRGKRSAAMIGGGGGAGALIGGLAGGGKGAAIGALAGAGAGTVGATMTGKRDVVIPAETVINFKLTEQLVLPPGAGDRTTRGISEQQEPPQGPKLSPDTREVPGSQPPSQPGQASPPPPSRPPR